MVRNLSRLASRLLLRFNNSCPNLRSQHEGFLGSHMPDPDTNDVEHSTHRDLHKPVCLTEAIDYVGPVNGRLYIDMTFGAGGHSQEILRRAPGARLVCLDRDPLAYNMAQALASHYPSGQVLAVNGKFTDLPSLLKVHGVSPGSMDGFLFDSGASSMQFDTCQRGFSLSKNGPLDMRMDGNRLPGQLTAADVVNNMEVHSLAKILKKYGEESKASQIAQAIVDTRGAFGNIATTKQLADIVSTVYNSDHRYDKLGRHAHVATKTFQALRIFVNNELNELYNGLEIAHRFLEVGGRCVVITFHSLEDRIVKRVFKDIDLDAKFKTSLSDYRRTAQIVDRDVLEHVTKKPWRPINKATTPSEQSVMENPRARSAKLRAAEKL